MENKEKTNIVFILPNLNGGGAERVAVTFLRSLDFTKLSVTLVLFHKTDNLAHLLPEQVNIIDLQTFSTSKSLPRLISVLKEIEPEVVFTTHSRVAFLTRMARLFTPKFKHIARMQGSPLKEKEEGEYGSIARLLYSVGFRGADVVIAQTASMKEEGANVFKIPKEKITVLNNPIDKAYIDEAIKTNEKIFPVNEYSIVAAGRLSYEKGFDFLIEALPKIIENIPNIKLHILGSDQGQESLLRQMIQELKLEQYVVFHGFISNPYPFYNQCDLFVLPSRHEGCPNVVLENYYLNTAIVATPCAAVISEVITDGENGYVTKKIASSDIAQSICQAHHTFLQSVVKNPTYLNSDIQKVILGVLNE